MHTLTRPIVLWTVPALLPNVVVASRRPGTHCDMRVLPVLLLDVSSGAPPPFLSMAAFSAATRAASAFVAACWIKLPIYEIV